MTSTDLVEREAALALLDRGLASAEAGQGRVALVTGEAGVGKSALVAAFAAARRERADLLWGACDALFTPRPLGPLRDIALQAGGPLLEALDTDRERHVLFGLFLALLQRRARPAIVVFEDLHWADDATLDLIKYAGRRIANAPVLMVATWRDDAVDARQRILSVVGELAPGTTLRVPLAPLTEAGVAVLAARAGRAADARSLHVATGGNAFYVTEVLAAQDDGVPPTVRDAVLARADRLPAEARAALDVAALSPGGIEPWLIEACAPGAATQLDTCVASGMLRLVRGKGEFRHELARQAVQDAVPAGRRRALHRAILAALRERPPTPAALARIAHHAAAAEDDAAVLAFAPAAAQAAAAVGAHREAAAHLVTAIRHAGAAAPRVRAQLFDQLGIQTYWTGEHETSLAASRAAADLWRAQGETLLEAEARTRCTAPLSGLLRDREADRVIAEVIALMEQLPPGPALARAYARQCTCRMLLRDHAAAMAWGEKALALAARTGATDATVFTHNSIGASLIIAGDKARGREHLEKSFTLAMASGLEGNAAIAIANLIYALTEVHDFAAAERFVARGIAHTTERDIGSMRTLIRACESLALLHLGRWEAAAETADAVLRAPESAPVSRATALRAIGRLRVRCGEPDAPAALDEALALAAPSQNFQRTAPIRAARAERAWLAGDLAATLAEARADWPAALAGGHAWIVGELAYWQWKAGAPAELPAFAAPPFRLQIEGRALEAAALWDGLGCPYEAARALGEADDDALRVQALGRLDALRARPLAERLRQQLREHGGRGVPRGPRAATRANAFGLTARELEVLALLAQGLSNAAIAARLYRSQRTVENHVASIFDKLSVATREAAVAAATARGLLEKNR